MSGPLAGWLVGALKAEGLTVKTTKGWKNRGRPYTFNGDHGVMFHHTASAKASGNVPSLDTVINGRTDLPGPLCHVLVGRDGTAWVIAAGYANHAGEGGPWKTVPKDSGNRYMVGVEVENNGIGEPWTKTVLDAVAKVMAAVLKHQGKNQSWELGHKEWTTRKIDPSTNMDAARADTKAELEGGSGVSADDVREAFGLTKDGATGVGSVLEGLWDFCRGRDVVADPIKDDVRAKAYDFAVKVDKLATP